MAAGTLAHGLAALEIGAAGAVAHRTLGVVYHAGRHADIGECHIVEGHVYLDAAPAHVLQTVYALVVQDVGIGAVEAVRLERAVEVEHQMIFGGGLRGLGVEVEHQLVVAVHEVDLEALHAHLGVVLADMLHVAGKGVIAGPENDADPLALGVGEQLLEVDGGHDVKQVGLALGAPAVVHDDIFDAVLGGEIDVMLICVVVDADHEVDSRHIEIVPPVPSDLARLDPAEIARRSISEAVYDVVHRHLDVPLAHSDDAPGESLARLALCKIVVAALDDLLDIVVAALLELLGQRSPHAVQAAGAVALQIHAGIVVERRLHDVDLDAVGRVYHLRQERQLLGMDGAQGRVLVEILERRFETVP